METFKGFLGFLLLLTGLSLVLAGTTAAPGSNNSSSSITLKPSNSRVTNSLKKLLNFNSFSNLFQPTPPPPPPPPSQLPSNQTSSKSIAVISPRQQSPCNVVPGQCSLLTTILEVIARCRSFIEVIIVRIPVPDVVTQVIAIRELLIRIVAAINGIIPSQTVLEIIAGFWYSCYENLSILIRIVVEIYIHGYTPPPTPRPPCPPIPPNEYYISFFCESLKVIQGFFYRYCSQCQVLKIGKALPFIADPRSDLLETQTNLTFKLIQAQQELTSAGLSKVVVPEIEQSKVVPSWGLLMIVAESTPRMLETFLTAFPDNSALANGVESLKSIFSSLWDKLHNGFPLPGGVDVKSIEELWTRAITLMDNVVKEVLNVAKEDPMGKVLEYFAKMMRLVFAPPGSAIDGAVSREALGKMLDSLTEISMLN